LRFLITFVNFDFYFQFFRFVRKFVNFRGEKFRDTEPIISIGQLNRLRMNRAHFYNSGEFFEEIF